MESKKREPKKIKVIDSIESLNKYLSQEYEYGHEGFDVAKLLADYGRLREFYCKVCELIENVQG